MAIVVVAQIEGGNQEFYEKVTGQTMPGGQLPDGAQIHIAGPVEGGWRVITVWDSEEHFERFRDEKLGPAVEATGDGIAPKLDANPVHRVITA